MLNRTGEASRPAPQRARGSASQNAAGRGMEIQLHLEETWLHSSSGGGGAAEYSGIDGFYMMAGQGSVIRKDTGGFNASLQQGASASVPEGHVSLPWPCPMHSSGGTTGTNTSGKEGNAPGDHDSSCRGSGARSPHGQALGAPALLERTQIPTPPLPFWLYRGQCDAAVAPCYAYR